MSTDSGAGSRVRSALRRLGASTSDPAPAATHQPPPRSQPNPPEAQRTEKAQISLSELRYRNAYWRVGRRILGESEFPEDIAEVEFEVDTARLMARTARRARAMATFAESLSVGGSFETAHVATVRASVDANEKHTARAITLALEGIPSGQQARLLGLGLVTHGMGLYDLAWEQFKHLPAAVLAEHVPVEAAEGALKAGSEESVAVARGIGSLHDMLDTATLVELAGRFLSTGHTDIARAQIDEAERRGLDALDERGGKVIANLKRWTHPVEPTPYPAGSINVGVIDYHQPDYDRASQNVGDYVQTLAMLGNLARFQKLRFTGDEGLGELATTLQARMRPEFALDRGDVDVHLLPVSRDFSAGDPIPPDTWMVAFGWHMHSMFRLRFGLPYHPNINPIFVSFHINRVQVLDEPTIAYLKEHGPIGCRDWTTVDLLLSAGVDAFFTGCLTTTANAVFPAISEIDRSHAKVVGVIDLPQTTGRKVPREVDRMTNADLKYREMGVVTGTYAAIEILADYQKRLYRLITSRLHAYLPATTLGLSVDFRPHVPGDVRFDGLMGMTPDSPELNAMRDGIRELILETFQLVLDGTPKADVYARWRELVADKVLEAKARHAAPPTESPVHLDVPATVERIRAGVRRFGPHDAVDPATVTDVTMSLDQNFKGLLPTTVESMLANASGPVRLWITTRGLGDDYYAWFAAGHPDVPITFLNFDGVEYGEITRMIKHISITTMDRLLLPEVLVDLDRITYVDIDTVTEGDICELASIDLRGLPLGAKSTPARASLVWRLAGDHLEPEVASELRRTMTARHPFDFPAFNAGVLVLDLARMRADRFADEFVPMAGRYGLNDQDVLIAYAGKDRVHLDSKWNALPVQEIITEPGVVHYAGAGKPWGDELVPYGEHWKAWEAKALQRLGLPPE